MFMSMSNTRIRKIWIFCLVFVAFVLAGRVSYGAALNANTAVGYINIPKKLTVREHTTTSSEAVMELKNNTRVTINHEVYTSTRKGASNSKWYSITANGKSGYIMAKRVDGIQYRRVKGMTRTAANYRGGPSTSMKNYGRLSSGKTVYVYLKAKMRGDSAYWYRVRIGNQYRYISASRIIKGDDYESYLIGQGFPKSYRKALMKLHLKHPNWVFKAEKTNLSFSSVLEKESRNGVSLVHKSFPTFYRDKGKNSYRNGKYIAKDGSSWYNANRKVVAYYLDPRHFLNENRIYMFESMSFHKYQKKSAIQKIIAGTALNRYHYTPDMFYKAGKNYKISPIFLASRARQENGSGGVAVSGYKVLGKTVYNPFNIGAYSSKDPVMKGMYYARLHGWTTKTKSVNGAAAYLADNYVDNNQQSMYLQRFNVCNGASKVGSHQYMTNIMAPYSESYITASAYSAYGITGNAIVFRIPVYKDMPKSTSLPK